MKLGNELLERLKSPTPEFWVKMRNIGIVIGSPAFTIFSVNKMFDLGLNETLVTVSTYVFTACAALVGSASLTQPNGILPNKDEKSN